MGTQETSSHLCTALLGYKGCDIGHYDSGGEQKPCLDRRSLAPTETCTLRLVSFSNKLVTSIRKPVLGF